MKPCKALPASPLSLSTSDGPETPVITGPSSALTGKQVTFNCSASSVPLSQYSWYFNGSLVANGSQYVTGPLTRDETGHYMCMAFNNITGRNTTAYTMLTVYGNSLLLCLLLSTATKIRYYNTLLIPDGELWGGSTS